MKQTFLFLCCLVITGLTNLSADYRILAFGDSNTWGWNPDKPGNRFSDTERWPGVLQSKLGEGYTVICDGIVARRTDIDGNTIGLIDGSFLNGANTLPAAIARNAPVDLVILFLGTNDLQAGAERSATEVASSLIKTANLASQAENLAYTSHKAPEVYVVVPPPFGDLTESPLKELFQIGATQSTRLWDAFQETSEVFQFQLIDGRKLSPDGIGKDGIHLNQLGHEELGLLVAKEIQKDGKED